MSGKDRQVTNGTRFSEIPSLIGVLLRRAANSMSVPDLKDNGPQADPEMETAIRSITFWQNGFSIGNGPLMEYSDPSNQKILEEINAGRAPTRILNVLPGQLVELRVAKRLGEPYTPSLSTAQPGSETVDSVIAPVSTSTTENAPKRMEIGLRLRRAFGPPRDDAA
ncbi:SEP domain-containing protein [Cristinia sonorae]|uniref:SEP domain-containing protein n=1 Tax=Cristinia sonorae TaxID=1940300 RepID=A0A8K0UVA9_9AGAR|nr:SEP domain-containing protein [Cristinia sonorae]